MTYCQQFIIADTHYQISTDDTLLAEILLHILAGFHSEITPTSAATTFEIKHKSDKTITVCQTGKLAVTYLTIDAFFSQFEWQLVRAAFDQMGFIGIHSGGVVCNGKTILFPGQSGHGKSTLTLGCILQGCDFLTDEMILIQPDTTNIFAFPRVLCIKNDAQIFRLLDKQKALQDTHIARRLNNCLCVSPQSFNSIPQQQPCPINLIIYPNYQPNAQTKITPVSPVKSLTYLLALTHKRTQTPSILDTLGQIVENAPSHELIMSNLPDAIKEVQNLAI
jgi:hypothetical protein